MTLQYDVLPDGKHILTGGGENISGNSITATRLQTPRKIGGVEFDGTKDINLPGVNSPGNQNTTGNAATATLAATATTAGEWTTARTITLTGAVSGSGALKGDNNLSIATTTPYTGTINNVSNAAGSTANSATLYSAALSISGSTIVLTTRSTGSASNCSDSSG